MLKQRVWLKYLFFAIAVLALCSKFSWANQNNYLSPSEKKLVVNRKETKKVVTNEKITYQAEVSNGEFFHLIIERKDVSLSIKLNSPKKKKLFYINRRVYFEPEEVFWLAEESGVYEIEIVVEGYISSSSEISISLNKLNLATEEQQLYVNAEQITVETLNVLEQQNNELIGAHLKKLEAVLLIWQKLGQKGKECDVLMYIGNGNFLLGERKKSLETYNIALDIAISTGQYSKQGTIYNNLGVCFYFLGDLESSLTAFTNAAKVFSALGDDRTILASYGNRASINSILGNNHNALIMFKEALTIAEKLSYKEQIANLSDNIGSLHYSLGEIESSLNYYNRALLLFVDLKDIIRQHTLLLRIGQIHKVLGEHQKSLNNYNNALQIAVDINNKELKAISLLEIADVCIVLGDYLKAKEQLEESLKLFENIDNQIKKMDLLYRVGNIYIILEDTEKAFQFYTQGLTISRAVKVKSRESDFLRAMGNVYENKGELENALKHFNDSLRLTDEIGDKQSKPFTLTEIAILYEKMDKKEEALKIYKQCLLLDRETSNKSHEGIVLLNMAKLESDLNLLDDSVFHLEQALNIVEKSFREIKGQSLKYSYSSLLQSYYELGVNLYMRKHQINPGKNYDVKALELCENSRAKILLQTIKELNIDLTLGIDKSLVNQKKVLEESFNQKSDYLIRLLSKNNPGKTLKEEEMLVQKQLKGILEQIEQIDSKIREQSPQYANLAIPNALKIKDIQETILDKDTLLLNYYIGKDKTYLWVVSQFSVKSYYLASSRKIEDLARKFLDTLKTFPNKKQSSQQELDYKQLANMLGKILLEPVGNEIQKKKLVIAGDGLIQILPFGALTINTDSINSEPLIANSEVTIIPSINSILLLREELRNKKVPENVLLALGDPIFDISDSRIVKEDIKKNTNKNQHNAPIAINGLDVVDITRDSMLLRLPNSRTEVNTIISLHPNDKNKALLDSDASLENLVREMEHYKYIHIASHGILNTAQPELSTMIMSLYDVGGKAQEGFLTVNKIFSLKKINAELIVLSGCKTGLGKQVKGEGSIGLTKAFLSVGARRVLSSLWSVSDEGSFELMTRFYKNLLKNNLPPSKALQMAQVSMIKDPNWKSPFYWAAFQLQGDWK